MSNGAKERFKRGDQAARKGNYEYAIELYLQGLTLDPKAGIQRRRLHEIEALAIESAGGNPEGGVSAKVKSMGVLAKIKKLTLQKKWDEVVHEIERALRTQPRNVALLLQLTQALLKLEAEDGAVEVLEEVVAYDRHNIEGLRRLGHLWTKKDDTDKAIEYWEKLRMIKPDDKEASKEIRNLSAANMVKRAEDRKAETGDESFTALLKDEEESADLESQSKVLRTDEDRRRAIKMKKDDLKKEPKNSRLWRELGTLYQDLKEWKYALAAYKKALDVNPHDLFANDKIGSLKEQRHEERLEAMRAEVAEAEKNGGAAAEELRQQLAQAEKDVLAFKTAEYQRRVAAHPTDYDLKVRYGSLLMESGNYDEAIEQFQKAVKDPKFKVASLNLMGLCFHTKGVHAVAITQYKEALDNIADPDSDMAKETKYNLAVASQQSGDKDTALQYFQEIMATDISYRDISTRVDQLMKS
ncbi:MAG: tetratricopeptide repeat protein [Planctomycetota bacterium]|nr:tetratricopeptide repeat protein [Planctomycetota bacterium]